jgi:ribonuclease VapC
LIIVDTSVLISALMKEYGSDAYLRTMAQMEEVYLSYVNYVEACVVYFARRGAFAPVDRLIAGMEIECIDVTQRQAQLAREAFATYGKGRHKAGLNICDCFAYALAKDYDAPLLFKGNDFSLTDIQSA